MEQKDPLIHIGKRMPYNTPEGCFQQMEEQIWQEVGKKVQPLSSPSMPLTHFPKWTLFAKSVTAIAAVLALVFAIHTQMRSTSAPTLNDVDQAFSQLSTEDQDFLLSVYQNDIFLE